MKNIYTYIILICLFSCNNTQKAKRESEDSKSKKSESYIDDSLSKATEIIEIFTDSLNIGKKGESKIEVIKYSVLDDAYVIVKFYTKDHGCWYRKNTYMYECNSLLGLEPQISDFNNDDYNDITFISATAGRGANEIRRLFIYDNLKKNLISIVNSQSYPNMLYNEELDCIDAFLVHGGSSTVFTRVKGDSLIEFASVHNDSHRTVYEIDKFGKRKLLRKDSIDSENIYVRYINYKPLKEYEQ